MSQHCFRKWFDTKQVQAITWTNADPFHWCPMGHNELIPFSCWNWNIPGYKDNVMAALNIKTIFPGYGDSHVKDKTVLSLTWDPYTGKMTSLHWDGPPGNLRSNGIDEIFTISWKKNLHIKFLNYLREQTGKVFCIHILTWSAEPDGNVSCSIFYLPN